MSSIKNNLIKWSAELKKHGKITVKSNEIDGRIYVYLVKTGADKKRYVGKLFFLDLEKGLGKKFEQLYTEVYSKVNKYSSEKSKFYRGSSLLVAAKIFKDEVADGKSKILKKIKWQKSALQKNDLTILSKDLDIFKASDIRDLLKLEKLATAYTFTGKKVYLPPNFKEVPTEYFEALNSKRRIKKAQTQNKKKKNEDKKPPQARLVKILNSEGKHIINIIAEGKCYEADITQFKILDLIRERHFKTGLWQASYSSIKHIVRPGEWKKSFRNDFGKLILKYALCSEDRVLKLRIPIETDGNQNPAVS